MPQLRLDRVSKAFPQEHRLIPAVQDVSLTIEQGEFVFLTGSSGAGKSTLLRLLFADLQPDQGCVFLGNANLTRMTRWGRNRARNLYGYVPQLSQLMRKRTIGENLSAVAILDGRRKDGSVQERVQKALAMVGLPGVERYYPVQLSLGECRRVELARAMIRSAPILLLDELTANLDEDTCWDMFHLLEELNHRGTTVVMATHAKPFVNLLRKRVVTLVDGRVFSDVEKGRYGEIC